MTEEFRRKYVVRLPLPIAQLYCRAFNAKHGRGRHDNAFYLFEALIKLAGAPLVAAYLQTLRSGGAHEEKLDALLKQLALPSLGQWVGILRETARFFDDGDQSPQHPMGGVWKQLNHKRDDLRGMLALFQRIKNGADGKPAGDRRCSIGQLIDSMVQYRNTVFGHGASRAESFYENEMGPLLLPALNDLLDEGVFDILGPAGSKLVYLTDLRAQDDDNTEVGLRDLVGLESERMSPLAIPNSQAETLSANSVGVLWPGAAAPLQLEPLLVYREGELAEEMLFLNRDRNGKHVEYLSYTTGRQERDKDMSPAMAAMMSLITGQDVGDNEMEQLRQESAEEAPEGQATEEAGPTGRVVGDFEIITELGRGGMGVVFLARQLSLGRLVAVKMLPQELTSDEKTVERFRREMRVLAQCEHPNIVKVVSSGKLPDGQYYYAMEYVPGADLEATWKELSDQEGDDIGSTTSLGGRSFSEAVLSASQKIRDKTQSSGQVEAASEGDTATPSAAQAVELPPLPILRDADTQPGGYGRRIVTLIRDVARALQTVHAQGIIHRDIKPANLMLTPDGQRIVLMDFGLARGEESELTKTSDGFLGTLRYSAPEQMASGKKELGPGVDVRGLGITLWELLTRKRVFAEAANEAQLANFVLTREVPTLRSVDPSLDPDIEAIVARATERDVQMRIPTARELADYLDLYLAGKPLPIRTAGPAEIARRWVVENKPVVGLMIFNAALLLATLLISVYLQTKTRRLANIRGPMVQEAMATLAGVGDSESALRGWIAFENEEFRQRRQFGWRNTIDPSFERLRTLSRLAGDDASADLIQQLKPKLDRLHDMQWWIEDGAHTPGNQPAEVTLVRDVRPALRRLESILDSLLQIERGREVRTDRTAVADNLADCRHELTVSAAAVEEFLMTGETAAMESFEDAVGRLLEQEALLKQQAWSPLQEELVGTFTGETGAYIEFSQDAIAERRRHSNLAHEALERMVFSVGKDVDGLLQGVTNLQRQAMLDDARTVTMLSYMVQCMSVALILGILAVVVMLTQSMKRRLE